LPKLKNLYFFKVLLSTSTSTLSSTLETTSLAEMTTTINTTHVVLTANQYLTHYWPMCNSDMTDHIGSADMTQGNSTSFTTDRFGNVNSALALNGGWTRVPKGYYFNTPEFTISVWVLPKVVGWGARVIDFSNGPGADNILFAIANNNVLQPYLNIWSGLIRAQTTQALTLGKWQFLAVTFTSTMSCIYLNGQLIGSLTHSYNLPNIVRTTCYIGRSAWSFDGYSASLLDDLRFYNKSLSASEILELFYFESNYSQCSMPTLSTTYTTHGQKITLDSFLTHYWPICNSDMTDHIGLADMTQGNLTSFTTDRFGAENSALSLNGGWTQIPPGFFFDTPEFTISVWVYPQQQVGSVPRIIDFGNGNPSRNIILTLVPSLVVVSGNNWPKYPEAPGALIMNKWQFLVGTFDGNTLSIYVDGVLLANQTFQHVLVSINRTQNYVGKSCDPINGFSFSILDELRFYNKSFSQVQILELFKLNSSCSALNTTTTTATTTSTSTSASTNPTTTSTRTSISNTSLVSTKSISPNFTLLSTVSLDSYLTHYWPICNGLMKDAIGSADMIQGNFTSFTTDRFGNVNSSLTLNGGWTQVPSGIYFDTPEFSISVWVYPQQIGVWSRVIDFGNGIERDNIFISFDAGLLNKNPTFGITKSIGGNNVISPKALTQYQWQHLAATFDGEKMSFYIGGILSGNFLNNNITIYSVYRTGNFIGKSHWPLDGFSSSYLDELRFYNKCLTQKEILELMTYNGSCTNTNVTSTTKSLGTTSNIDTSMQPTLISTKSIVENVNKILFYE
jgi:hypothetical protein